MFTIICIYNNQKIFKNCLQSSLNKQEETYESIFIDNTLNKYKCVATVFNEAAKKAKGDYIIFLHHDIVIEDSQWLTKTEKALNNLENVGIVGVAGCKENEKGVYTNIRHGKDKRYAGEYRINKPTEVQTVDECLFIIPKEVLKIIQFDETTCDNWHFYAVDFCLQSVLKKYKVYVIPSDLYHMSDGNSLNIDYYKTAKKIFIKYKNNYKNINTTSTFWKSKLFKLQYIIRVSKYRIIKIIKKIKK